MMPPEPGNDAPTSNDALRVVGQEKRNGLQRISQRAPPVTNDSTNGDTIFDAGEVLLIPPYVLGLKVGSELNDVDSATMILLKRHRVPGMEKQCDDVRFGTALLPSLPWQRSALLDQGLIAIQVRSFSIRLRSDMIIASHLESRTYVPGESVIWREPGMSIASLQNHRAAAQLGRQSLHM